MTGMLVVSGVLLLSVAAASPSTAPRVPIVAVWSLMTASHSSDRPDTAMQPPADAAAYEAVGSGHYIRRVDEDGRVVVLEDGSRWEVDPAVRFKAKEWRPEALITVRRAPVDGYGYDLTNTDVDEGVFVNYLGR